MTDAEKTFEKIVGAVHETGAKTLGLASEWEQINRHYRGSFYVWPKKLECPDGVCDWCRNKVDE